MNVWTSYGFGPKEQSWGICDFFFFPYHCIIWGSLCPQHLYPNEREIIQTWFGKGPALVSKGDFGGTEIALRVVGEATCSPLNAYIWFWPEFTNDF